MKLSSYFFGTLTILKNFLLFREAGQWKMSVFFWIMLPILPFMILGWVLADLLFGLLCEE
jgi:hypothetical protein